MNVTFLVFLFLVKNAGAACLSGTLSISSPSDFDLKEAELAIADFESIAIKEIPRNLSLVVNMEVLNPRVNAEINKNKDQIVIDIMGGMLMHPKMKPDTLKLLLCHELGHLLGGEPLKSRNGWSSTEGQADYYSGAVCAKNLGMSEFSFLKAAVSLTTIYAEVTREAPPRLDSSDPLTVNRTNYGYPPVQCRLDTLISGWRGGERPYCWFRP